MLNPKKNQNSWARNLLISILAFISSVIAFTGLALIISNYWLFLLASGVFLVALSIYPLKLFFEEKLPYSTLNQIGAFISGFIFIGFTYFKKMHDFPSSVKSLFENGAANVNPSSIIPKIMAYLTLDIQNPSKNKAYFFVAAMLITLSILMFLVIKYYFLKKKPNENNGGTPEKAPNENTDTNNQDLKKWPAQNTAIMVVHGIGHQNPLETLDEYCRGFIGYLKGLGHEDLIISHEIAKKKSKNGENDWYDNFIRISKKDHEANIDIFEYFWAHNTEDKAPLSYINKFLSNVTSGAKKFYELKENEKLAKKEKNGMFFKDGKFLANKYMFVVSASAKSFMMLELAFKGIDWTLKFLPFKISFSETFLKNIDKGQLHNRLNDITIYNTTDVKSSFYEIRRNILEDCINSMLYLLKERTDKNNPQSKFKYPKILLAGHSLGSQIAFDTMNRLNHLFCIEGEDEFIEKNTGAEKADCKISDRFAGFITFGSPLDKIAFFFRERIDENSEVRKQILNSYHSFKRKNFETGKKYNYTVTTNTKTLLDDVRWLNFYDRKDYISGHLDFYNVDENFDCKLTPRFFTHDDYWSNNLMHRKTFDLIASGGRSSKVMEDAVKSVSGSVTEATQY